MTFGKNLVLSQAIKLLMVMIVGSGMFSSCGMYSFTGASIPPEAKTVSVALFPNQADLVQPILSQTFTEALRDRFVSQTSLTLVPRNGDLALEGEITGYTTEPVAISGSQQAAQIRLKITVNVRFTNKYDPKADFESKFTRYYDYSSNLNLFSVEAELIETITKDLVDDIFNKGVVNW